MSIHYEALGEVESYKEPGKVYTINRHKTSGTLSCTCGSWRFKTETQVYQGKEIRTCKHLRRWLQAVKQEPATTSGLTLNTVSLAALVGAKPPKAKTAPAPAHVAPQRTTGKGMAPQVKATLVLLLEAAGAVGVRDLLAGASWSRLAEALAPKIASGLLLPPEQEAFDLQPLRRIYLED